MRTFGRFQFPSTRPSARTARRTRARTWDLLALGMLGVLVIGAPELFGGVFPWSLIAIASLAVATLLVTLWGVRAAPPRQTPPVVLAVCGAAAWTCVQGLPLPCRLVSWLAPDAVSELRSVLWLAGAPSPSWCTLSRDPGATRFEVLVGVAIVSSFLSAWWLAANGERSRVIWLVACSSLAMSLVAHFHMSLGLHEVFGVYQPLYAGGGLQLAPLMNPNNLGGFAALGVPIWLGILVRSREASARVIAVLAVVICATTAMLSLSRGAIAVLFGSAALFVLLQPARSGRSRAPSGARVWRARLSLTAALALAIAFAAYLATDRVLQEFEQGKADKFALIAHALQFATHHPWLGVGRGAFASTYTARGDTALFLYAENFFTQWAGDWGFPVAIALVLAVGHALWRAFCNDESRRRLGALVALVALATQNLFDLGLELAGVAVVAAALLGAVVAPSRRIRRIDEPRRIPARTFSVASLCVAAMMLAWFGPTVAPDSVDHLDAALRSRVDARDRTAFAALLTRAVRMHPVEPRFAVLAASESLSHRDHRAPRWINRAMRLAPGWTAPHAQAFAWLWQGGHREQALLEMRAAAEIDPRAVAAYACGVAQLGSATILQAAPRTDRKRQRADFIELASNCLGVEHQVTQELDRVLLREFPQSPAAREREAVRLAKQGELDAALSGLGAVLRENPTRVPARTLEVQLLFDAKRYAEAARIALELTRSIPVEDTASLWRLRAGALAALGDDEGWPDAVSALRRIASNDTNQLADTYALEGQLHVQRNQPAEALRSYRVAYSINKDSRYLQAYADLSTSLGDRASALWAFMELCQTDPGNSAYCAQRDALLEQARAMNFGGKLGN